MISASQLYDYIHCQHKVWRDKHGPRNERIETDNEFVELLWTKGRLHEAEVLDQFSQYSNVSTGSRQERFEKTKDFIQADYPWIYQGLLMSPTKIGIPDLLMFKDGTYYPVDIKSGHAFESRNSKYKDHYTVQLAFYVDIMRELGLIDHHIGYIIDDSKTIQKYDLKAERTKGESYWSFYQDVLQQVIELQEKANENKPALKSACKICVWYESCKKWAVENDDPSILYKCSGSKRDTFREDAGIHTIQDVSEMDIHSLLQQKKADKSFLKGIGEKTLEQLKLRADLYHHKKNPIIKIDPEFPEVKYELFFDIEDDPTQEFVYMHGVYERQKDTETYKHFTARDLTEEAEKIAWVNFWAYIEGLPKNDFGVYYYSAHEKTTYRKLQKKYPDVISADELEDFFRMDHVIDLYAFVNKHTEWPTGSYSLKALAVYLGFKWRDESPSGALSIQWFNDYIDQKDQKLLDRILEYNEDDCKATMVLKDGIEHWYKTNNQ